MEQAILITGSNQGDKVSYLRFAKERVAECAGKIIQESSIYESDPWGYESANAFLNQCLLIQTGLSPQRLLEIILTIETDAGRIRYKEKKRMGLYTDRTLDIDILFYGDFIVNEPKLIIPHPKIETRRFVLLPLSELTPEWIHPVTGKSVIKMLADCEDLNGVRKVMI